MNFSDFQTGVNTRIQDDAGKLVQSDKDALIKQAVNGRYSKDRPRELVSDVQGNGTSDLLLPAGPSNPPEQFEDGFSLISTIEFPIGQIPETFVEDANWKLYRSPSGVKIRMLASVPSAQDVIRVAWTVRHSPGTTGQNPIPTTVPDADFEAVCDYAASLCLEALAARYAQTGDSTINADTVNYRSKSQEYSSLAKALRKRYDDHIGINEGGTGGSQAQGSSSQAAAIAIGNLWQTQGSGADRLTHKRGR
jgi:hypothetical protein